MGAGRATGSGGTVPRGERRRLPPPRGRAVRKGLRQPQRLEPGWGHSGSSIRDCGNESEGRKEGEQRSVGLEGTWGWTERASRWTGVGSEKGVRFLACVSVSMATVSLPDVRNTGGG